MLERPINCPSSSRLLRLVNQDPHFATNQVPRLEGSAYEVFRFHPRMDLPKYLLNTSSRILKLAELVKGVQTPYVFR